MLSIAELQMDKVQKVVGRGKIIKFIQVLNSWRNWTLRFFGLTEILALEELTSTRRLILKVPAHLFSCTLTQKIFQVGLFSNSGYYKLVCQAFSHFEDSL